MKKIFKFIKKNFKLVIAFSLGFVLAGTSVYAANTIYSKNVTYDNSNSGLEATNVQDALDETYTKCFPPAPQIELGDYVSLIPTDTSGQELMLWRVININDDGTVDIISEYVSSATIGMRGTDGGYTDINTDDYRNYVAILNDFVTRYENDRYTADSRSFGYNGQTESLIEFNYENNNNMDDFPEYKGGGDTLYEKDYNLVMNALGTLKATKADGSSSGYWIASRFFDLHNFGLRYVAHDGTKEHPYVLYE